MKERNSRRLRCPNHHWKGGDVVNAVIAAISLTAKLFAMVCFIKGYFAIGGVLLLIGLAGTWKTFVDDD